MPSAAGRAPRPALSAALRRRAYGIPEHHARRWMLLLMADRLELVEHRLAGRAGVTAAALLGGGLVLAAALRRRRR